MHIKIMNNGKIVKTFNTKTNGLKLLSKELMASLFNAPLSLPFTMNFTMNKIVVSKEFQTMPTLETLKSDFTDLIGDIASFRNERKTMNSTNKVAFNGALTYKVVGGVFPKVNSINSLIGPEFKRNVIDTAKKPNTAQKKPYVGLELELNAMVDSDALKKALIEANLYKYVQVGSDGSVRPHKGGKSYEIRAICLEEEVEDVVTRLCAVLNSKPIKAYVNSSCGFHVHMDCRHRDAAHVFKNLVMGLPLLSSMVPQERVTPAQGATHYCKQNDSGNFENAKKGSDRYMAINPMAYGEHKTIEVRLHSGTVNAKKIINWVKVLATLANNPKTLTRKIKTLSDFQTINSDSDLHKYMEKRIKLFSDMELDTVGDEMIDQLIDNGTLARIVNL